MLKFESSIVRPRLVRQHFGDPRFSEDSHRDPDPKRVDETSPPVHRMKCSVTEFITCGERISTTGRTKGHSGEKLTGLYRSRVG